MSCHHLQIFIRSNNATINPINMGFEMIAYVMQLFTNIY